VDLLSVGIGLFGGAGITTIIIGALRASSYDDGYRAGRKDGYDQCLLDDATKSGGYIDSVRVLQRANRALNEERARWHIEEGHLQHDLDEARQVIGALTTAAKLAAEAEVYQ
jgi:hypothetical protein